MFFTFLSLNPIETPRAVERRAKNKYVPLYMLLGIGILLLLLWGLGVVLDILGGIIYIFLVVGLILAIVHFLRRATR